MRPRPKLLTFKHSLDQVTRVQSDVSDLALIIAEYDNPGKTNLTKIIAFHCVWSCGGGGGGGGRASPGLGCWIAAPFIGWNRKHGCYCNTESRVDSSHHRLGLPFVNKAIFNTVHVDVGVYNSVDSCSHHTYPCQNPFCDQRAPWHTLDKPWLVLCHAIGDAAPQSQWLKAPIIDLHRLHFQIVLNVRPVCRGRPHTALHYTAMHFVFALLHRPSPNYRHDIKTD